MNDGEHFNGQRVVWSPTERQKEFLACPAREACFGGSLGGAKTDGLLMAAASQTGNPKHRALFLRRSFPQLRSAIERSHELFTPLGARFNVQTSTWVFPPQSRVEFAFLDSDSDRWRYAGRAFSCVCWDELCEWPNDSAYIYLLSRLRTTKGSNLRLEVRSSANPLGPGASWVRQRFAIPDDGGPSECIDPATGFRRVFIPARISDNPHLLGSDYERQLQALPTAQRKALLEGRWDCVSGAVFDEFSHDKHVCDGFAIPAQWNIWRGADDGFAVPAAVLWFAHDEIHDRIYVVQEFYASKMTPTDMAGAVRQIDYSLPINLGNEIIDNDEEIEGTIDSASFADTGQVATGGRAGEMNRLGCKWKPASKGPGSRFAGLSAIHSRLALREDGLPGLVIFRRCRNLIRELSTLTYSTSSPEETDPACSDHAVDALRYGLVYKKHWFKLARVRGL